MAINIRKNKNGKIKYVVRVRDINGRYFSAKSFDRKSEAQIYERELLSRSKNQELSLDISLKRKTVDEYFTEWFQFRKHKISEGWFNSQVRMYNVYFKEHLAHRSLLNIQPPHIGHVLTLMYDKGMSDQSVRHAYNLLNHAFKDAVEYFGYLAKNPVSKKDRPKVFRTERAYLKPNESWILMNHSKEHYLGPAIWIAILSGLRISEIQALRWKSIDFEKNQILVCEAFKRSINKIEPYPKQKDWAIVPMPQALHNYLEERSKHKFPADFVAPALYGGMLDHSKFYRGLKQLTSELNLKHISPHGLRHSCTEIWFQNGANLEDVRRLLNHKTSETTQRYVHRTDDRLSELAKAIKSPKFELVFGS